MLKSNTKISQAVATILDNLGENSHREGLRDTPTRVAKSLSYLTSGIGFTARDIIGDGIFKAPSKSMILQRHTEFYSLCEHHLLPFFGHVHIAYLPNKHIIGLSKMGRLINIFSRRLQVQENLTKQIAQSLQEVISPSGVAVMVEAQHFCMMMRGVQKQGAITCTSEFSGEFESNTNLQTQFLHMITQAK